MHNADASARPFLGIQTNNPTNLTNPTNPTNPTNSTNSTHHNQSIPAPPVFPVKLNHPFVRSETDPPGLERFLDCGDIPPNHEKQIQIASWCVKHWAQHEDDIKLKNAIFHLIEMSKIDHLDLTKLTENSANKSVNNSVNNLISLLETHKTTLKTITKLTLSQCKINANQITRILENPSIQSLDLSRNNLGTEDGIAIGKSLENNNTLLKLNLSNNNLYSAGCGPIFDALKHNKTLIRISFSQSHVCEIYQSNSEITFDAGIYKKIVSMLMNNIHLETLDFSRNAFGPSGLLQVMMALKENSTLRNLLLGYHERDHLEILAIADMLKHNKGLRSINLAFSTIFSNSAEILAAALQSGSCTLVSLDLYGNKIDSAKTAFASAMQKNTSLCNLNIDFNLLYSNNAYSEADIDILNIQEACQRNLNNAKAFYQRAVSGFIQSWAPYPNYSGRFNHEFAEFIASRIDPLISFESDVPGVNKLCLQMTDTDRILKKSILKYQMIEFKKPSACKMLDLFHFRRPYLLRRDFKYSYGSHFQNAIHRAHAIHEKSPFLQAAQYGNLKELIALLDAGEDPDQTYHNGCTSISIAALHGHLHVVKYLMDKVSDPFAADLEGRTPFFYAAQQGHLDIIKTLIKKGESKENGGKEENLKNINKENLFGSTPLTMATQYGHLSVIEFLLANGADVNHANSRGFTPFYIAAFEEEVNNAIISTLIKNGANLDSDFHFEKEHDLSMQYEMMLAIGKTWLRILTAPELVKITEMTEIEQSKKNAQTLIDRLSVMSEDALMVRLTAVTFASSIYLTNLSLEKHPYLAQLFDIPRWISEENTRQAMLEKLSEKMKKLDAMESMKWEHKKTPKKRIFEIEHDQLPAMTKSIFGKLNFLTIQ